MENVIIVNPNKLEEIKNNLRSGGPGSVHILSDFDRTLTHHSRPDYQDSALVAVLGEGDYLPPDYKVKVDVLYKKYYPIEYDPNIPLTVKKAAMIEWWRQMFNLMISSGLTKEIVARAMKDCQVELRDGVEDWLDLLRQLHIPLVIFSASGLGRESINIFLDKLKKHLPDIHILANAFIWDESGRAIGVREPIIHSYNKDETLIQNFPFFSEIKNRRNVILLGDSLGDVGMVEGFEYDNLLKIGFLNGRVEENLESFKKVYDVIILGDSSFAFINRLFKEIFL